MRFRKMFTFGLVVLLTFSGFILVFNSTDGLNGELNKMNHASEPTYIRTEPIRIDNNGELAAEASSGSGTQSDPYIIENYEIDGDGHKDCIYIGNTTDHFIVRNCYLYGCNGPSFYPDSTNSGLYLYNVENGTAENNILSHNNGSGISILLSKYNVLSNNTLTSNDFDGIAVLHSDNNLLSENNLHPNHLSGIYVYVSSNNTFMDNNVSSNNIGIEVSSEKSYGNILTNNTLSSNKFGIYLDGCMRSTLKNNTMKDNGIMIWDSNQRELKYWNTHIIDTSNTVNGKPVYFWKNREGGTIPSHAGHVILVNSTCVTVKDHIFYNYSSVPFLICFSDDNVIEDNIVCNNRFGIYFYCSERNTVRTNTFSDNNYGIYIRTGKNNTIYRNRFIDNKNHAVADEINNWDGGDPAEGGKGGNYWSDYNGSDRGDGVGDEPYYNITYSSDNPDNYPWVNYHMVPWSGSFEVKVEDLSSNTEPVFEIYDAYDMTGELMNGVYNVNLIIDRLEVTENLTFTDGHAEYTWGEVLEDDEYTGEVIIDGILGFDDFYVDSVEPSVESFSPKDGLVFKTRSVTISWSGTDDNSGMGTYEIRLNNGDWIDVGTSQSYTFAELNESTYEVDIRGYDNVGHNSTDNLTFTVDLKDYLTETEVQELLERALEDYLTEGNFNAEITRRLQEYMSKDNVSSMIDGRLQDYLTEQDIHNMIDDGLQSSLSAYLTDEEINLLVNESLADQQSELPDRLNEELQDSLIGYLKEEDLDNYLTKEKVESMQSDQDDDISMSSNIGIVSIVIALIALIIAAWTVMKSGKEEQKYDEPIEEETEETFEESDELEEDFEKDIEV